ncbi:MAG TPA: peptidylprolyl isomerase [Burkholderiales bacterium]|nr:peptidylprolyl isomerase [Burkholderiales bacterium]
MQVGRDRVVSLKIQMYDAQGALLHAPEDQHTYLHGGYGGLLDALERSIEGKGPGEKVRVQLEPEQAFGEYDAELLRVEEAERYGEGLEVGMEIEEDERLYTVTDVAAGKVVLDANHPLAGIALRFSCEVISVRAARPEEIERGVSLP